MIFWLVTARLNRRIRKDRGRNTAKLINVFQQSPKFPCLRDRVSPREVQGERKHIQHRVAINRATGLIVLSDRFLVAEIKFD